MIAAGKISPCVILLELASALSLCQPTHGSEPEQPEAVVRNLYSAVVAHHPVGIPDSAEMKSFSPYLSKGLLHRIDDAKACEADWDRQYTDLGLNPPGIGYGLFSGDSAPGPPRAFEIEKTDSENDGSFRVHVTLRWEEPPWGRRIWHPVAIVVREDGHLAVDDITYPQVEHEDPDSPLSEYLSAGCDGAHWIGFGGQRNGVKQPEALIRSLYQQVVAHHPVDIPYGTNMRIFAPYMSNSLLHNLDVDNACAEDWNRQHPDPNLKPPVYEGGLFSGGDERTSPRSFEIERTEHENDGSVRVFVKLTLGSAPEKPEVWEVAPILVEENGHLVVDDVVFVKDGHWLR